MWHEQPYLSLCYWHHRVLLEHSNIATLNSNSAKVCLFILLIRCLCTDKYRAVRTWQVAEGRRDGFDGDCWSVLEQNTNTWHCTALFDGGEQDKGNFPGIYNVIFLSQASGGGLQSDPLITPWLTLSSMWWWGLTDAGTLWKVRRRQTKDVNSIHASSMCCTFKDLTTKPDVCEQALTLLLLSHYAGLKPAATPK